MTIIIKKIIKCRIIGIHLSNKSNFKFNTNKKKFDYVICIIWSSAKHKFEKLMATRNYSAFAWKCHLLSIQGTVQSTKGTWTPWASIVRNND